LHPNLTKASKRIALLTRENVLMIENVLILIDNAYTALFGFYQQYTAKIHFSIPCFAYMYLFIFVSFSSSRVSFASRRVTYNRNFEEIGPNNKKLLHNPQG
jgi:hypothetical protein